MAKAIDMMNKFQDVFLLCDATIRRLKTNLQVTEKALSDFVTNVDLEVERVLMAFIHREFPNDLIISEESLQGRLTEAPTWVMDPIDGTNNFLNGSKIYGIQICRVTNFETDLAALYLPEFNDYYFASREIGVYRNGVKLEACVPKPLSQSIVSFGGFSKSSVASRGYELKLMDHFKDRVMGIRIFGSSCMDFLALASGQTQAHIMFSKRIWEIAAGVFVLEMMGIHVERIQVKNTDIIAVCGAQGKDVIEEIRTLLMAEG